MRRISVSFKESSLIWLSMHVAASTAKFSQTTLWPLDYRVNHYEHKTLASLKVTVEARANLVRSDLKKRAEDLDARHPGSTFVQELAFYGKYFVLVSGPFANLSRDFNPLVDFIARERSLQTIEFRDFRPDVILSMQKRALIRRIGLFLCRGWAQHIVDR